MKIMISFLIALMSVSAFASNEPTVCDAEISNYMENELGALDVVGPVAVLARTEKMTIQRVIADQAGGYAMYEVVTRNSDCAVLATSFIYAD
ncbi:hypothetical protein [Bdellovibrio sp. HCB2-146]|uniref:hypothetical protein n=1 Tax=Bdellovibrio sp. HCB2-146 TaxID=3394362 RepID=UPI0039BC8E37